MRNIQEWKDIQGGETDRSTETHRRGEGEIYRVVKKLTGVQRLTSILSFSVEKLTGGRD